jgi:curli biogenesis system outer membrane secretion channel CsgG
MRVLALLVALLSLSVVATGQALAQQTQQNSSGSSGSQSTQTPRHPGDYCTSHCRSNEIPCGRGCMSSTSTKKCTEKVTTTCAGKP